MFKSVNDLCDVVSVVIYCFSDATMLLVVEPSSNEYWIPSVKVTGGSSWSSQVTKDLITDVSEDRKYQTYYRKNLQIFGCVLPISKLMRLNKVWIPYHSTPYISHAIFEVQINADMKKKSKVPFGKVYRHFVSTLLLFSQETLYKEFLLMTFPAIFVGMQVFSKFLLDVGWTKEEIPQLFRSADINNRGGISFREFLYFLAAVEPGTTHGGGPAELRCRYIFRYLDVDKNNLLKRDEMRNFVFLVRKARKQLPDPVKMEKELADCYRNIGIPDGQPLNMSEFLKAVGDLKIRGTSQIYRAPNSIQKYIKEISDRNNRQKNANSPQKFLDGKQLAYAKSGAYEMAVHSIMIQRTGNMINIEQLWNIDSATSQSSGFPKLAQEASRKKSADQFDQQSKSNELLKAIRHLTLINKMMQCYGKPETFTFTWGKLDPAIVARNLVSVCNDVREIFIKEPRMLDITSPAYIMGDLHGNFTDLIYFEKILWHVGPGLCPCNLLFLGDYVDRGLFSVEVISYLFSYKLQSPNKLKMLRGNHEIKRVQQQWTFEKECKLKFGDRLGGTVFNAINDAFDTMPLAAVIDGRVFCCHGGIPPPWLCPVATAINDIPPILNDPQDQSSLAWELMWNDPIRAKTINEKIAMELLANEGFAVNSRRGTAHIFSVEALEKFLNANGFTHLVRAHEVVEAGFYLQQKGHLLTIFSSSKYCGGQNVAACILADQGRLRILRLETE
ncbi:uncharacterized protein BDFB_004392 [Asbolus verrucosus]|uniref:Serine/threonine-protein phosphatase n=1 Tax=Asbolus verrucosus TaxID=1661398 RepID=A0A482W872_ASBVE|nr:uncharacterized protein BDFB_004392 [Asbolus verrucosus]